MTTRMLRLLSCLTALIFILLPVAPMLASPPAVPVKPPAAKMRPAGFPGTNRTPLLVPSQYPNIQAAVNASQDGDTVMVADGPFSGSGDRDIDLLGKSITITSQNGPTKTIIDCGGYASTDGSGNHRGFYIHSGEKNATISGFTVKNGYETYVSNIPDSGVGGGVFNENINGGRIMLTNCTITANTAQGGGGVSNQNNNDNGTITLTNCIVTGNAANTGSGGGISNSNYDGNGGTITLTNCAVARNTAQYGGGIANYNGGYLTLDSGTINLTNCAITSNFAFYDGGGIFNRNGGYDDYDSGTIASTNCTITKNAAYGNGEGIYNSNDSFFGNGTIIITNCVVYADNGSQELATPYNSNIPAIVIYCDIQGGSSGIGNINADPQFVNATAGDLHLKPSSPCLGAGTSSGAPATDLDGNTRPNPPSMGAYELGVVSEDQSKLHLLAPGVTGDAAGIVCDNLSGMDDATKDKLTLSLPDFLDATNLTGTVTAPGPNTNDTGEVRTVGTTAYYFPPDEYNENQVPQDVTKDITKSATRTVTLTLHFTAGGTQHVITKPIILARTPVVLVHGINSDPSDWKVLQYGIGAIMDVPFVAVNHSDPLHIDYLGIYYPNDPYPTGWLLHGNAPVEVGAYLLAQRIQNTLTQVHTGGLLDDSDQNGSYIDANGIGQVENNSYASYFTHINGNPIGVVGPCLADKRVDVVAWSYGGVVTRWYLASNGNNRSATEGWYRRHYVVQGPAAFGEVAKPHDLAKELPSVSYGGDVRKVITIASMWRGVPLSNYANEATFADNFPSTSGVNLNDAPLFYSIPSIAGLPNLRKLLPLIPIKADAPSMEVLAINSKWLSSLIYAPNSATALPFLPSVAYGSVAGNSSKYIKVGDMVGVLPAPVGPTLKDYLNQLLGPQFDPYLGLFDLQQPSWFRGLLLEVRQSQIGSVPAVGPDYTDGLVPNWSAVLPGGLPLASVYVGQNHHDIVANAATWNYVTIALSSSSLPHGDTLNGVWDTSVVAGDGSQTWTFGNGEMAPHTQNSLYQQIGGIGRINPTALTDASKIGAEPVITVTAQPAQFALGGASFVLNVANKGTEADAFHVTNIIFYQTAIGPHLPYTYLPNPVTLNCPPQSNQAINVSLTSLQGFTNQRLFCTVTYQYQDQSGAQLTGTSRPLLLK